jgi:aspartokinase
MITISNYLEKEINRSPYLRNGIARHIINLTALAREMLPEIESQLLKPVSLASVVMALKRYQANLTPVKESDMRSFFSDMTIKSSVIIANLPKSKKSLKNASELMQIAQKEGAYFSIVKSTRSMNIIADKSMSEKVQVVLGANGYTDIKEDLGAIVIRVIGDHDDTPGVFIFFLQQLADRGISVSELVYIEDEVLLIMKQEVIDEAFFLLRKAFFN